WRGDGLGRGFASGVDAVGSSTSTACGSVQSVRSSPLARANAMGTGGSTILFLPGSLGKRSTGIDTLVVAPLAVACVVSVGPAPPSTSGRTNPASWRERAAGPLD